MRTTPRRPWRGARPDPRRLPARGSAEVLRRRRCQPGQHPPGRARLPAAQRRPADRRRAAPGNLGYGGNQKAGYQWAIDHGLDIVVLLHGDGQYAPEMLPSIVAPLDRGEADAVFGSRMIEKGGARRGGMPMYKYVGNRILTTVENAVVGTTLSEWHSGYRAYSVAALPSHPVRARTPTASTSTPRSSCSSSRPGKRIVEIPIPTYYGDEICHVNGIGYARDVASDVMRYRAHKMGFGTGEMAFASTAYEAKEAEDSSHVQLLAPRRAAWRRAACSTSGCSDGRLADRAPPPGPPRHRRRLAAHEGGEGAGRPLRPGRPRRRAPAEVEAPFDVVLAADVLEHVREPDAAPRPSSGPARARRVACSPACRTSGTGTRGPRSRSAASTTTAAASSTATTCGSSPGAASSGWSTAPATRPPAARPPACPSRWSTGAASTPTRAPAHAVPSPALDRAAVRLRPQLFAYQFLYELRPAPSGP